MLSPGLLEQEKQHVVRKCRILRHAEVIRKHERDLRPVDRRRNPHRRGGDAVISTATVREPAQRIGEWTRIAQRPVAYARGTECDRKGSVKGRPNSCNRGGSTNEPEA